MGKFNRDNRSVGGRGFNKGFGGRSSGGRFGGGRFGGDRGGRPQMHDAICSECGNECQIPFKPTGEKPVYCSSCFDKKGGGSESRGNFKKRFDRPRFDKSDRQMHDAICDKCGKPCQVPFAPTPGKPVYCNDCFDKNGNSGGHGSADYTEQFQALNKKLDEILKTIALTMPKEKELTTVAAGSGKKASKPASKTKSAAKKTTKKK